MATRKATLKTTTTAARGSNQMPVMFKPEDIANIVHSAFEDDDKAKQHSGTATQRMACGVFATWLNWVNNGHPDKDIRTVPDLSLVIEKNEAGKQAMTTLKGLLTLALIGEAMSYEGLSHDDKASAQKDRTNKLALLTRAMIPAAIIKRAGVTLGMFNRQTGCFAVPPSMLLEAGCIGVGRLSPNFEDQPLLLNNRTFMAQKTDGGAGIKVQASIEQLRRAYSSKNGIKATRATRTPGVKLSEAEPAKLAADVTLANLVRALHIAFVPTKGGKRKAAMPNDLPLDVWNMLSDIAQENDAIQESDTFRAAVKTGVTPQAEVVKADAAA